MHALVKRKPMKGLWLETVPVPTISPSDVLIEIIKTAICGTDLHIYNWDKWSQETIDAPLIIGHEFVGRIKEGGSNVSDFKVGELVSGEGHITCGKCRNCRKGSKHLCRHTRGIGVNESGAFANFLSLPVKNVFKVDESIPTSIVSFFDAFGNAVHTTQSLDLVGEDVLITGAGPIGIMSAAICRHVGARHVVLTDFNDYRLKLAEKITTLTTVNLKKDSLKEAMSRLKMKEGFDICLEMSGQESAFNDILQTINYGGTVSTLGIFSKNLNLDWNQVIFKSLTLKGIYGREIFDTWYKMTSLIKSGLNLKPLITHEFSYKHYQEAFDLMEKGHTGKIILNWNS